MEHLGDPGGQEMGSTARDRAVGPSMVELKYPPHFFNAGSGDDETGSQFPLQPLPHHPGPSWSFSGTSLSLWQVHVVFQTESALSSFDWVYVAQAVFRFSIYLTVTLKV